MFSVKILHYYKIIKSIKNIMNLHFQDLNFINKVFNIDQE